MFGSRRRGGQVFLCFFVCFVFLLCFVCLIFINFLDEISAAIGGGDQRKYPGVRWKEVRHEVRAEVTLTVRSRSDEARLHIKINHD